MHRRSRFLIVVTAAVAALALAAPSAGAASKKADKKLGKAGVIVAEDLPADWTSSPPDNSGEKRTKKAAKQHSECKAYLAFLKANKKTPRVESREFALGNEMIENATYVTKKAKKATKAMRSLDRDDVADCLAAVLQDALETRFASDPQLSRQVTGVLVKIQRATALPSAGDQIVGHAGGVQVDLASGSQQRFLVGYLAVRVDRVVLLYNYLYPLGSSDFITTFDHALDASIARTESAVRK